MKLILVRHGTTSWNLNGKFQGQSDIELNEEGQRQAAAVGQELKGTTLEALYSSPLKRSLQTANAIAMAKDYSLPVITVDDLQEMDLGGFHGKTGPEIRSQYPSVYEAWRSDPSDVQMPGGESLSQVQTRAWKAIEKIKGDHATGIIAAVSHNFTIVTVLCRLLGVPISHFHSLRIDLASLTTVEWDRDRWILASLNGLTHLRMTNS